MEESQELVNAHLESFSAHTKHAAHVTEKLTGGKLLGQSVAVRQIAAPPANIQTIFDDIVVKNSRGSARWIKQPQQYANRRRLAGPIMPHETENISGAYSEGDVIDSARVGEIFAERADFYRIFIWQCLSLRLISRGHDNDAFACG